MSARPTPDELLRAAEWLSMYEDDGGTDEVDLGCHRVAAWLREQADAAQLREVARHAGVTVAFVRKAMAAKGAKATGAAS